MPKVYSAPDNRSQQERDELVVENRGLAWAAARRMATKFGRSQNEDFVEELAAAGMVGLVLRDRQVAGMVLRQGRLRVEAARVMGVSKERIRQRMRRVMDHLRRQNWLGDERVGP